MWRFRESTMWTPPTPCSLGGCSSAPLKAKARAVFGTHDLGLIARLRERALAVGAAPGAYEVHMLYGIRAAEQRALQSEGVPVRVLISYGTHWFPGTCGGSRSDPRMCGLWCEICSSTRTGAP